MITPVEVFQVRARKLDMYNPILSEMVSEKELNFRREGGLCMRCGQARPEPGDTLCYECCEAMDIQLMHHRWSIWKAVA
jgi:hypothetical protein